MERLPQFSSSRIQIGADGAISAAPALKTFSTNEETPLNPAQVSQVCDAVSFLLTEFGCPPELRGFVVAVIGAAAGRLDFFELSDIDLAKRLWKDATITHDSLKRRVKRLRDEVTCWQIETGITIISYLQGDKIDGKNLPTQYRVDCLHLVGSTLEIAPMSVNFDTDPTDAFMKTAADIVKFERFKMLTPAKMTRRPAAKQTRHQWLKSYLTFARKYVSSTLKIRTAFKELRAELDDLERQLVNDVEFSEVVESITQLGGDRSVTPDLQDESEQADTSDFVTHVSIDRSPDKIEASRPDSGGTDGDREGKTENAPVMFLKPQSVPGSIGTLQEGSCDDAQQELEALEIEGAEIEENYSELADFFAKVRKEGAALEEEREPLEIDVRAGEALQAADLFQSVGARLDLALLLDDATKVPERRELEGRDLSEDLPELVAEAGIRHRSFIVRVRGPVVQVDDCDERSREFLEPLAFITVETSPGSFQAWIAVEGNQDLEDVRRRVFLGMTQKGMKGNGGSHGALRWPGSLNFKPNRQGPGGAPAVRIVSSQPDCRVTLGELAGFGLLPKLPTVELPELPAENFDGPQQWPSYDIALATKKRLVIDGVVHWVPRTRSDADASFVVLSLDRGFSESQIVAKLMQLSGKAQEKGQGERYILRTIRKVRKDCAAWLSRPKVASRPRPRKK